MDEVPWGGEFTDDDAPPPPYETNSEPFTWGPVATNDANVASMDVRRRHEQADYAELEQFGGSDEEKEYELIQHERALAAERAAREAEAASAAWEREACRGRAAGGPRLTNGSPLAHACVQVPPWLSPQTCP